MGLPLGRNRSVHGVRSNDVKKRVFPVTVLALFAKGPVERVHVVRDRFAEIPTLPWLGIVSKVVRSPSRRLEK